MSRIPRYKAAQLLAYDPQRVLAKRGDWSCRSARHILKRLLAEAEMRVGHVFDSFLETPHVHHWDSMMVFDETTRSLFPADLFMQAGEQPPVVTENLGAEMYALYRSLGIFAHEAPVRDVVNTIEQLKPEWATPCTAVP